MWYTLLKPLLFRLDAERAHELVSALLRVAGSTPGAARLLQAVYAYDDPILETSCAGLRFANPVGLAAGFDKRAALIDPIGRLGFSHVEVGTVTPRAQPGNPRPRMFRLPEDGALINRLGFNSPGMVEVACRLRAYRQSREASARRHPSTGASPLVGVNIGKNRDTSLERAAEDYIACFVALAPLADYVMINISSPNTPGLRRLHDRAALEQLLGELAMLNRRLFQPLPIFVKVSPDESDQQLADVVRAGCEAGIAGIAATNTTLARERLRGAHAGEAGGLSGAPLAERAQRMASRTYQLGGGRLPVIGVGGIDSAEAAFERICAGASLVQLYTGLVYAGPGLVYAIKRGVAQRLRRAGFRSIAEAVGSAVR
jgi:dihydroorotate dehydrogenase